MRQAPSHGAALALLAALTLGSASADGAAASLEEHFSRDWFHTEVIVFLRPGVHDYTAAERLTGPPTPLAATPRTLLLPPEQRFDVEQLPPATRAQLTFPYLDPQRLDLFAALAPEHEPFAEGPFEAPLETAPEVDDLAAEGGDAGPAGLPPPMIEPRLAADPLLDFLRHLAQFEAALEQDSYRPLEDETFVLANEARALARRGGYPILLHQRWLQPVPPRGNPQPLLVQAGPRYRDGFALEGTLEVTRGRFLHFGAHLLYREPLLGQAPLDRALPPRHRAGLDAADSPFTLLPAQLQSRGFMELRENRRVSDEQIAYFDHPKLGVLVRIQPVEPPAALVDAHQALRQQRAELNRTGR